MDVSIAKRRVMRLVAERLEVERAAPPADLVACRPQLGEIDALGAQHEALGAFPVSSDATTTAPFYRGDSRLVDFGRAKLRMRSPPRRPREPPPDATVTNSSPSTMYTAGDAKMPEPVL